MELRFEIEFHGPFRVGGGAPTSGMDAPVNLDNPLPATGLKGLMRAQAAEVLGLPPAVVEEVFGSRAVRCPWAWSDGVLTDAGDGQSRWELGPSVKVSVDERGRARRGFLRFAEVLWSHKAGFIVERMGRIAEDQLRVHRAVLYASAASITALGESRLRGFGWVRVSGERPEGFAEAMEEARK